MTTTPTRTPGPSEPTGPSGPSGPGDTPAAGPPRSLGTWRAIGTIGVMTVRGTVRDRTALFFVVALPITVIVLVGVAFGSRDDIEVGVLDRDDTAASRALIEGLDAADGIGIERFDDLRDLRIQVRTGSAEAGLVIPDGYGAALDRGDDTTVDLVADPTSSAAAAVQATVRAAVGDAGVRIAAARTAADASGADESTAASTADGLAGSTPTAGVRSESVDDGTAVTFGSFDYSAPSNLVLFTFVNTMVAGSMLAFQRQSGITRRMLATPHGTGTILAGLGASVLLFSLLQSVLILAVGGLAFGVDWGDPIGVALVVVLFAVVSASVGLFVGATVSDPEQAQAAGVPISIALGMLGGCMWPLAIVPPLMRTIGHIAPQAWAMDAWIELIFLDHGVVDILPELAVLSGFAIVLGLLARRRLRRALTS